MESWAIQVIIALGQSIATVGGIIAILRHFGYKSKFHKEVTK